MPLVVISSFRDLKVPGIISSDPVPRERVIAGKTLAAFQADKSFCVRSKSTERSRRSSQGPERARLFFMDIFSLQFLYALGAIILIDLVLAGDNAIVIALAARKLPPPLQRRAVIWGTVGAIAVRSLLTVVVVWLLKIPGLLLAGGALLLWIAVKLILPSENDSHGSEHGAATTFVGAMKTIVVADAVMGLDNVLAVAGAAHGSFLLVTLGLLISIPIVVWGSTLILKWVERFPIIVYVGAAVLALTAAKMMLSEPLLEPWIAPYKEWSWLLIAFIVASVIGFGYFLS
jgi:YjbE family integral membrane protein